MRLNRNTKLEKYARTIRLRDAERRALRDRIISYMEYHPQIVPTAGILGRRKRDNRYVSRARILYGVFVATILFTVVPVVAEQAMPGDVLYPVKVRLNEEVMASLTFSPHEKIAWNAERVERRIAEARLLAKEGRLTEEAEATIVKTVREYAENANRGIVELRETDIDGAAEAQIAFESTLDVQEAMLETDAASASSTGGLATAVKEAREGLAESTNTPFSFDRFKARVETETTRSHELFGSIAGSISSSERGEIERRLEDIDRAIAQAELSHAAGTSTEESIVLLRTTLSDLQKLMAFMADINVRTAVTLERLVPVKLTHEEQLSLIDADLESLRAASESFSQRIPELSEEEGAYLEKLSALITAIEEAKEMSDYETAGILRTEARVLLLESADVQSEEDAVGTSTPQSAE